jgi:PAS domain S-box-containing protein
VNALGLVKLLTCVQSLVLATVVVRRMPRGSLRHGLFAAYVFAIAAQAFVEYELDTARVASSFLVWKQADVFIYLAVALLVHFVLHQVRSPLRKQRWLPWALYGSASIPMINTVFFGPTSATTLSWGFGASWTGSGRVVHQVGDFWASALGVTAAAVLVRQFLRARAPRQKKQAGALAVSTAFIVGAGILAEVVLPRLLGPLPSIYSATTAFLVVNPFITWAILRWDLFVPTPERASREILAKMSDGVLLATQDGTITFANAAIGRMLQCDPRELLSRRLRDLPLRPAERVEAATWLAPHEVADQECFVVREAGAPLPASISSTWVESSSPDERAHVVVVRDTSERQRADRIRGDAERVLRHDLRNSLCGILGHAELVQMAGPLNARQQESIELVARQGALMLRQMELYLALQRIESGTYKPPANQLELDTVLRDVVDTFYPYAASRQVQILLEPPAEPTQSLAVRGEDALLFGMVSNLLKNAVEASPTGGAVTLSVRAYGDEVCIGITNAGAVPDSVRGRFFERFTTAKPGGTGLGTYSAKLVADALGGSIAFTSSEAAGTTVTVRLPAAGELEPVASGVNSRLPVASSRNGTS